MVRPCRAHGTYTTAAAAASWTLSIYTQYIIIYVYCKLDIHWTDSVHDLFSVYYIKVVLSFARSFVYVPTRTKRTGLLLNILHKYQAREYGIYRNGYLRDRQTHERKCNLMMKNKKPTATMTASSSTTAAAAAEAESKVNCIRYLAAYRMHIQYVHSIHKCDTTKV